MVCRASPTVHLRMPLPPITHRPPPFTVTFNCWLPITALASPQTRIHHHHRYPCLDPTGGQRVDAHCQSVTTTQCTHYDSNCACIFNLHSHRARHCFSAILIPVSTHTFLLPSHRLTSRLLSPRTQISPLTLDDIALSSCWSLASPQIRHRPRRSSFLFLHPT